MDTPTLIYCGGGNRRFYEIATNAGFRYGSQLPKTIYGPLYFADQDWKRPNREAYMAALAKHTPTMATVLDWEHEEQLPDVLDWAEEAAQYCESILIVPKVQGGVCRLPRRIGSRDVVLAYSVPTKYGGTELPIWDFAGWPVHLLGGAPQHQMRLWSHLSCLADVVSVDGNYYSKMANLWGQYWTPGNAWQSKDRYWPRMSTEDREMHGQNALYEAFRRSCENIVSAWQRLTCRLITPEEMPQ